MKFDVEAYAVGLVCTAKFGHDWWRGWVQEPPLKFKFVQLVHTTYLSTACQISSGRPAAYTSCRRATVYQVEFWHGRVYLPWSSVTSHSPVLGICLTCLLIFLKHVKLEMMNYIHNTIF